MLLGSSGTSETKLRIVRGQRRRCRSVRVGCGSRDGVDRIEIGLRRQEDRRSEAVLLRLRRVAQIRHRSGELDVDQTRSALEPNRSSVSGSVDVVLRIGKVRCQTLARQSAGVAAAEFRYAGALLGDVPIERDGSGTFGVGPSFRDQVDLRKESGVVQPVVIVAQTARAHEIAGMRAQLAADDVVMGFEVTGDSYCTNSRGRDRVADIRRQVFQIDARGVDPALEVSELQVILLVERFERFDVLVPSSIGIRLARF